MLRYQGFNQVINKCHSAQIHKFIFILNVKMWLEFEKVAGTIYDTTIV